MHIVIDQKPIQFGLLFDTAAGGGILATGQFDLALISLQTNPDPDMSWHLACDQRAPAGYKWMRYCNPSVDANLRSARSTFDRVRRKRALAVVQHDLLADAAFDPLYRIDDLWVAADWLRGNDSSAYDPFWNIYDWEIEDR